MSGLLRYTSVLRLFNTNKPDWTVAEIGDALETPHSTIYRTVRELAAEGFVEHSIEAHYRLGAAFVEFDRNIRLTDPLVRNGAPLLRDLIREADVPAVAALARLYGNRVICAADEKTQRTQINASYERGRPMPLTRGATSLAVLAHIPKRQLRKLISAENTNADQIKQDELSQKLADVRRGGFCITRGEVDKGLVGVAVPIHIPEIAISASLSFIVMADSLTQDIEQRLVLLLVSSANLIGQRIREQIDAQAAS